MNSDKKTTVITDISLRQASLIGGFSLLVIAILTPVGYAGIIHNLIVPGNAAATVSKLMASKGSFLIGICCLLANAVLDLVGAWALYIILKPVNKSLSLLSAWFRVAYTVILVVALGNLFKALQLLSGADYLKAFDPNQLNAGVMMFIKSLLFCVGSWICIIRYFTWLSLDISLIFKSDYLPKFLGILLKIAGLGYLVDHIGGLFFFRL